MCPWNQQNKTHKDVRGPFVTKSQHTRYCWDYVRNIFPECPPPMLPPTDVRPPHHRCCSSCKMSFPLPLPNAPDVLHIAVARSPFHPALRIPPSPLPCGQPGGKASLSPVPAPWGHRLLGVRAPLASNQHLCPLDKPSPSPYFSLSPSVCDLPGLTSPRQAHQRDLHQEVLGGDLFLEEGGVGGMLGTFQAHFRHRRERPDLPLATDSPRGALRETPGRVSGPRSKACDRSPCARSARSGAGLLPAGLAAPSRLPGWHGAPGAPKGERGQALVARSTLAGWVFPPEPCAVLPRGSVAAGNGTHLHHPSLLCWGGCSREGRSS